MHSFKKIALGVVAAMTLGTIVATPASAAPLAVTVSSVANTTTLALPATVAVPSTNTISAGYTLPIAATADTGTVVTFTASSTVKLVTVLSTVDLPKTVASGVSALSATSNGLAITVYAYTTSTAVGSVTVTNGAYSTIVYVQGTAGPASNVALSVPTSTSVGTIPTISALATDVFGNPVGSESISVTLLGSTFTDGSITKTLVTSSVTSAAGITPVTVLGTATATLATAVAGEVTVVATGVTGAVAYTGLNAPVRSVLTKFVVSDLAAQIVALKAELAAEKAAHEATKAKAAAEALASKVAADKALADALTKSTADKLAADATIASLKKSFNTLITKWNKAHPKAKIALIK